MTFYSGVRGCVCVAVCVTCCREHVCVHVFVFIYYIPEQDMQILHKIREGRGNCSALGKQLLRKGLRQLPEAP